MQCPVLLPSSTARRSDAYFNHGWEQPELRKRRLLAGTRRVSSFLRLVPSTVTLKATVTAATPRTLWCRFCCQKQDVQDVQEGQA